jgi:catechol 2,3-dioxygenase-like lactoylglutathione lyase family enzyme
MNKPRLALVAIGWLLAAGASAQPAGSSTPAPTGLVVGSGNFFSPIVGNLDRAIEFYRDGIGLDVAGQPSNADANLPLRKMFGLPDAQIRWTVGRPAGMRSGVEIVEIAKAAGKPAERRIQDGGAFTLIVLVRDVDATLTRVKQTGAPVVTKGGAPVTFGFGNGKSRGVVVKDPDGHFVELFQFDPPPETTAPASSNVVGVRVRLTVEDAQQALHLYRDVLGLQQGALDEIAGDASVSAMLGITGGQFRMASAHVPGSGLIVEFMEFKGIEHRKVESKLEDPGSTRMQLQVRDIDAAVAALRSAGGVVVSTGGGPVELAPGRNGGPPTRVAIVRDPNNLFVVLIQAPPAPNTGR